MNIYDEKKVITHEEARNIIDIDYDVLSEHYDCEKSKKEIKVEKQKVLDYITEQQAKEQRAKKVEKELEEIKALIRDIGDGAISFETSYQRMVFEALMNKIGRTSKVGETKWLIS